MRKLEIKYWRRWGMAAAGALLFLYPWAAYAQQEAVSLRMEVDKRQVEMGDSLTLTLEFRQIASGNASVMGEPQIPTPEHFEIRGQRSFSQINIVNGQTMSTTTNKLELLATKTGDETLGPALMIYQDSAGKKKEVRSNVATVTVVEKTGFSLFGKKKSPAQPPPPSSNPPQAQTQAPPGDELRDIKPISPEGNMIFKFLFWLTALGVVVFVVWQVFRKPHRGPGTTFLGKPGQLKDAWKKLGNEELSGKEFCAGMSSLVRECLQYRYGFGAVDLTTEEILKAFAQHKPSGDELAAVEKCLKTCDRVLYADANLTGRDNLRSLCSSLLPKIQK